MPKLIDQATMPAQNKFCSVRADAGEPSRFRIARSAAFGVISVALLIWGSPPAALIMGMLFALTLGNPIPKAGQKLAKVLLQGCVVMLGFGMNLPTVLRAGYSGALFAALTIGTTLLLGYWVGRRLALNRNASALISAGTAICGGSAIAAVASVLLVTEAEIAMAIGTVFFLNAVSLYLFPALGHALGLTQHQFGVWAGVAIHDISSVVGASLSYGPESLQVATAVKLSRTLWIIPVTFAIAIASKRAVSANNPLAASAGPRETKRIKPSIPWFIAFFLLASVMRSYVPAIAERAPEISRLAQRGFTMVLFLIGTGLSLQTLRAVGWKAAVQGITLWVFISAASLGAIVLCGVGQ